MTITQLLQVLQVSARNAGVNTTFSSDPYTLTEGHLALRSSLSHFLRETKCVQQTSTALLPSGTNEIDLSSIAGWHPERQKSCWVTPVDTTQTVCQTMLRVVEQEDIISDRERNICTGTPQQIGFGTDLISAITDKTSDQAYTLSVKWFCPLTSWTIGDTGAGSTSINVPGDMAEEVVRAAGVCFLQTNQPEQQKQGVISALWAEYLRYVDSKRGSGNMGVRSIRRSGARELRDQRRGW